MPVELSDDLEHVLLAQIQDAEDFSQNELASKREKTWRYYNGQIDIKAPRDRSAVVRPEVRNAVEMMMPQIMGVFASAPVVVEFSSKIDPALAEEATEKINCIFWDDNDGWVVLHDAIKDSLVTRCAGFKVHLLEKEYVEGSDVLSMEGEQDDKDELGGLLGGDTQVSRWEANPNMRFQVEVVPTEELLIDRFAKDAESATLVGQKSRPRLGDLVQMGFPAEKLKTYGASEDSVQQQTDTARTGYNTDSGSSGADPSQWQLRKVEFTETFHRVDINDDGELERVQVCCIGDDILQVEEVQEQPYILFSSIRIPHTAVGRCPGELLIDNQDFESVLMRQTLDNLFWSNNPAIGVLRNAVNPFQVDNWGFGSVIDQRVPNAVQVYQLPFFADKILPMFEFFSQQKEQLVGISKASAGLDVNAFRNQTAAAAVGMLNAAQRQIEMLARVIAQTGLVPLFKKLFKLIYSRPWPYGMKINVGLGNGSMTEKFMILGQLKQAQEAVLMQLGPDNPLCSMMQYGFTLNETAKLAPYYPANAFFNPPSVIAQKLQEEQQKPDQPKPDPKMLEAQAKVQETQQRMELDKQKAGLEAQKTQIEIAAAREKQNAALQTDRAKASGQIENQRKKVTGELAIKQQEMIAEANLAEQELVVESQLEELKIRNEAKAGQGVLRRKKIKAPKA